MLVLTRKVDETIVLDGGITIMIVAIDRGQVRIGIEAPKTTQIWRKEVGRLSRSVENIRNKGETSDA